MISDVITTAQPIGVEKIEPFPAFASMLIDDFFTVPVERGGIETFQLTLSRRG